MAKETYELPGAELFIDSDADAYSIGVSIPDGEARVRFYNEFGLLSSFVTDSTGLYDLAQRLLRAYDQLEGID
jgi:hypothetical protein